MRFSRSHCPLSLDPPPTTLHVVLHLGSSSSYTSTGSAATEPFLGGFISARAVGITLVKITGLVVSLSLLGVCFVMLSVRYEAFYKAYQINEIDKRLETIDFKPFEQNSPCSLTQVLKVGRLRCRLKILNYSQEPTETSKQPIKTQCLGHVTGYQPIRGQYFLIRSVPDKLILCQSIGLGLFSFLCPLAWQCSLQSANYPKIPNNWLTKVPPCLPNTRNLPNQEILVPDWLITSHVTLITSSDCLFTCCFPHVYLVVVMSTRGCCTIISRGIAPHHLTPGREILDGKFDLENKKRGLTPPDRNKNHDL
eukprot:sb/3467148/